SPWSPISNISAASRRLSPSNDPSRIANLGRTEDERGRDSSRQSGHVLRISRLLRSAGCRTSPTVIVYSDGDPDLPTNDPPGINPKRSRGPTGRDVAATSLPVGPRD